MHAPVPFRAASLPSHVALSIAIIGPALLAYNVSPSATLLNQLLAVFGWGAVLVWAGTRPGLPSSFREPLWLALGGLAAAVAWSHHNGLPAPLAWSALALLAAAAVVARHGMNGDARDTAETAPAFHRALLLAGIASAVVALIQVFAPSWADGDLIARSGLPGRAVGNLRQPNHLSSLLLWALVAWVPVAQAGDVGGRRVARAWWLALAALLIWAVVLSASRTGIVGVVLLAAWGLVDRRLARWLRVALMCAPVAYLLFALGMSAWAHLSGHVYGGEVRLGESDVSASRWGIWSNTLALIRDQPWGGVGFGEFNFAWTLTPFPGRPVAFFDHSHNLPLQLMAELGVPLGGLVTLLLAWALVQAGVRAWRVAGEAGAAARAAFVAVLMIGVHSLFEYPLWYAYFLLPTAWAWGLALRQPAPTYHVRVAEPERDAIGWLRLAGVLMVAGALFAVYDYWKVVVIYAPTDSAGPLSERIERGQGSVFFSHHADYAAATTTEPPSQAMASFDSTTHSLLDTRLMLAWSRALAESGHRDKASYLAARLREFHNPASADFFDVCNDPAQASAEPKPFQCEAAPAGLDWHDFQPRAEP